jgi:hypothetical protein
VQAAGNGTGDEGLLDGLLTTGMMSAVLFVSIFLSDDNDAITSMCLVRTHLSHWFLNYHVMSTPFKNSDAYIYKDKLAS